MSSFGGGVLVVGGFSKIKAKKDSDKGTVLPSYSCKLTKIYFLFINFGGSSKSCTLLDRWPGYP